MQGDLYDNESLVKAIKQVDVVISTVGHMQLADQVKIISAIKEAGNVKVCFGMTHSIVVIEIVQWYIINNCYCIWLFVLQRFFPSEFGNDVDRVHAVEPAKSAFAIKAQIRRAIKAEGIPYTYVSSNYFAGYFLPTLLQPGATAPPRDKVIILGDGNPKGTYYLIDPILRDLKSVLVSSDISIDCSFQCVKLFSTRKMTLEPLQSELWMILRH